MNLLGYSIAGLFVLTWVASALIWRFAGIEQKCSAPTDYAATSD